MRARISLFVGIIVAAGVSAAPAASEDVKSLAPTYRPWTKICFGDLCLVAADVLSGCRRRFGAALIERSEETKKTLRVAVPDSVDQARGVRISIDQDLLIERPYGRCYANVCSADIDDGLELIARLKRGRKLVLDAIGANGPVRFGLPLADFAAAYDGPPQEPKAFEAQPGKLQEELKAREEHRQQADTRRDAGREAQCDLN